MEAGRHYELVEHAIAWLMAHQREQPELDDLARALNVSPWHLQKVFTAWAGISPKKFLQYVTRTHALNCLRRSATVLEAALESGLSGPGRLHDLMVTCEALTPGEIRSGGRGVTLYQGVAPSLFGEVFVAWTERGICRLAFVPEGADAERQALAEGWPEARIVEATDGAVRRVETIFSGAAGEVRVLLRGSPFQVKVWEALLSVPPGHWFTYQQLAALAGVPGASRAVGSVLARNPLGVLIPCHRVIRATGVVGQYRWGTPRKVALHIWEAERYGVDTDGVDRC